MLSNGGNNTCVGELVDIDFNPNFDKLHYSINRFDYIYINFSNPRSVKL